MTSDVFRVAAELEPAKHALDLASFVRLQSAQTQGGSGTCAATAGCSHLPAGLLSASVRLPPKDFAATIPTLMTPHRLTLRSRHVHFVLSSVGDCCCDELFAHSKQLGRRCSAPAERSLHCVPGVKTATD